MAFRARRSTSTATATAAGRAGRSRTAGRGSTHRPHLDPRVLPPPGSEAVHVLGLQRTAGNAAVADLVRGGGLQRKSGGATAAKPKPFRRRRPVLKRGDGPSPDVAMLQQALNAALPWGGGLRVTGVFDLDTQAAVTIFQGLHATLRPTGIADKKTWAKLDAVAPRVVRQGRRVVLGPEPGQARGTPDAGTTHPTIKLGSKGPAVEELQQKLNTVPAKEVSIYVTPHGKFDKTTRIAVQEFQRTRKPPLPAQGVVGKGTWAALDAVAGPVTVGRESYEWSQRAEGTVTGSSTRFTWRLQPDRLEVTVNIKFTGASKDPKVNQWRQDIADIWNTFKFVDTSRRRKPREARLDFIVGSGTPVDATVKVHKTPKKAKEIPRSDAANWHTGDNDKGLAPHEFGHLIGLQDEYNKGPEAYTVVTGEQPLFGELDPPLDSSGNPVAPETIAKEMRKAVTSSPAAGRGKRAQKIVQKYKLVQGGFAQRVALAYEKAYKGNLLREEWKPGVGYKAVKVSDGTMGDDLAARIPNRFDKAPGEAEAVAPFFYSNRGIMGTMEEVSQPTGLSAHDHPVAERHVRYFLAILQRNRPGTWKTVRR